MRQPDGRLSWREKAFFFLLSFIFSHCATAPAHAGGDMFAHNRAISEAIAAVCLKTELGTEAIKQAAMRHLRIEEEEFVSRPDAAGIGISASFRFSLSTHSPDFAEGDLEFWSDKKMPELARSCTVRFRNLSGNDEQIRSFNAMKVFEAFRARYKPASEQEEPLLVPDATDTYVFNARLKAPRADSPWPTLHLDMQIEYAESTFERLTATFSLPPMH